MSNASSKPQNQAHQTLQIADTSSNRRWLGPAAALLVVIVLFAAGQFVAALLLGIVSAATGGTHDGGGLVLFGDPVLTQFAFGLLAYGLMLAMTLLILRSRNLTLKDLGVVSPRLSDAGWALVAFLVYIAANASLIGALKTFVPGFDADQRQDVGFDDVSGIVPLILVFLALVVLAPFAEEVLMRGFLFGSLRHRSKFWVATLVTSLVFAGLHLGGGEDGSGPIWVVAADTFVLSLALCYLREKTGRLWASIGLHSIKNGVAFAALFIFGIQ